MISTDELQQRILAEVEECAAEQELVTLLNTEVADRQGRPEEVTLFREAMEQLSDKSLILMAPRTNPGNRQSRSTPHNLVRWCPRSWVCFFGADDLHWTADPFGTTYAVLTESGRRAGAKLLDERGYQWWCYEAAKPLSWTRLPRPTPCGPSATRSRSWQSMRRNHSSIFADFSTPLLG